MKKEIKKHYKSVFENEQDLLKAILDIHIGTKTFDLDPMYFKGNFYKDIPKPNWYYDINKELIGDGGDERPDFGDATNLHWFNDGMMNSIILDPPFLFGVHGKTKDYYSSKTHTIYKDFDELYIAYENILKEAYRLLKRGGHLVFKCQDYTDSKTTMTHCIVYLLATTMGFYAKDLAILVKPNKITNPNTTQRHLRKIHTYFWVFKK